MRKEILNSIIITVLLIASVYFVVGGLVGGVTHASTHYNATSAAGVTESATNMKIWNYHTNYTGGNGTTLIVANLDSRSLFFNFTINNSAQVSFNNNATNITIILPSLFQPDLTSYNGNITPLVGVVSGFKQRTNLTSIIFYNDSYGGLTNGTTSGGVIFMNGTFQINITVNGTGISRATPAESTGNIRLIISNGSNTDTNELTFGVGVDNLPPRITGINATVGSVTQRFDSSTTKAYLKNGSNVTIKATITDANIWFNNTADKNTGLGYGGARRGNITIWWNASGVAHIGAQQINMSNSTSCTWAQGASGCQFEATLPLNESYSAENSNLSFIIIASDYFDLTSNNTNSERGYNITFDNTAADCEVTIPDGRFIIYRQHTVSCSGDINETRLYEAESDVEICKDINSCTGIYTPQSAGTKTLRCETSDAASNRKTCEIQLSVASRATVYDGEGAAPTIIPIALDISKETQTTGLSSGQSTTFKYETVDHTIKIDSITSDSVTLTIDGTISASIPSGGSKELDLTGDGTKDIKITLNRVLLNKADISIEKLAGATVEPQKEVVQEQAPTSLAWLWWVLIAIVLAVIIYLVVSAKKKR